MKTRIRENGYIFTETTAKKEFQCRVCIVPIRIGEEYLKVERAGGGVSWAAHPDRIHNSRHDIELYLEKYNGIPKED